LDQAKKARLSAPTWKNNEIMWHCFSREQLAAVLDLNTPDEVFASVREIFPDEEPPGRLRLLLEDIFSDRDKRNP
jgi:hypothetical protein